MTTTPDLGIPELAQAQANPEVTFNEALVLFQALLNGVIDKDLTAPPGSPVEGDAYLINTATPTGAWALHPFRVAIYWGGAWRFVPGNDSAGTPITMGSRQEGLRVWVRDENAIYTWQNSVSSPASYDWVISSGGTPAANSITNAILRQSVGTSVIGRSANTTGDVADIVAGTNDRLFAQVSNALSFVQLTNGMVPTNTVGLDKLVNASAQYNIMARTSASAGAWEQKASSADIFATLGAANYAAARTLWGLGAAALLGVAVGSDVRTGTSTSVLVTPGSNASAVFKAYRTTDQTGIADATYTKITFNTEGTDVGGWYDNTTNYRWTPLSVRPVEIFINGVLSGTFTAGNLAFVALYKNGSLFQNGTGAQAVAANSNSSTVLAIDVPNGTTDYYEAYAFIDTTAGTGTLVGNIQSSNFQGYQL